MRTLARRLRSLGLVVALVVPAPAALAQSWGLDASTWARPRSGQAVVAMRPLPQVVRAWSQSPSSRIVIRYPGGEDGELWAHELRDWLVALGVPSGRVALTGGGDPGVLGLEVAGGGD